MSRENRLKELIEEYGYYVRGWRLTAKSSTNCLPKNGTQAVCSYRDAAVYLDEQLHNPEYTRRLDEILHPVEQRSLGLAG